MKCAKILSYRYHNDHRSYQCKYVNVHTHTVTCIQELYHWLIHGELLCYSQFCVCSGVAELGWPQDRRMTFQWLDAVKVTRTYMLAYYTHSLQSAPLQRMAEHLKFVEGVETYMKINCSNRWDFFLWHTLAQF